MANRGRKRKPKPAVPILAPKTQETKIEEAKAEIVKELLAPENISPERMPNIAGLDSYEMFTGDVPGETPGKASEKTPENNLPAVPEPDDGPEVIDNGDVVELDSAEEYVEIEAPKPVKNPGPYENIRIFDKIKEERDELKSMLEMAENELEDTKKMLDAAISEKKSLSEENATLKKDLESVRKRLSESVPKAEYDRISNENDELLLKNSELELENSIAKESIKKTSCEKASVQHTYSPPGYSQVPNRIANNTRPAMNGYQDWI